MAYRTVNLKPATFQRLAAYKVAGISFDDAVGLLMDEVAPQAIKTVVLERLAAENVGDAANAPRSAPVDDPEDTVEFLETRGGRGAKGRRRASNKL